MRTDEETKRKWRRIAYGKLLIGTATTIQAAVHGADNRYEFERPHAHESKVMTEQELKIFQGLRDEIIRAARKMMILAWHLQGHKKPRGFTP